MIFIAIITLLAASLQCATNDIIALNRAPDLRPLKRALGYIEDTYLNFTELTKKYGFPSEEHAVTTQDGYILTVYRIPSKCSESKRYPVMLMHGIIDSSDAWIITKPKKALGYILASDCYDVWAGNGRGNVYSRRHTRLDPDRDPKFWDFTFEESGVYDVSKIIDYVLKVTGKEKVLYVGHSQGTTIFFTLTSLRPEYNDKVQLSIHLAPVAWMSNIRSPLALALSKFTAEIAGVARKIGLLEVGGKNQYIPHEVLEFLCQAIPLEVCAGSLYLLAGSRAGIIKPKTLSVAFGHIPVGTSLKTLEHFAQLITSKRFQRYDLGKEGNLKMYGSSKPPVYDVKKTTTPTVLIGAKNDWISDLRDVKHLGSKLPNLLEMYVVPNPFWSHNDHLWGTNVTDYEYFKILQYFNEFSNR
ncbi:lipase 3-like [Aricia agestis]|uniref:lipase 3-like n=1 Tax=Aricia agestis TaxID=91739 RepID=UPI001C205C0A|nr:lipase 3-like [Aricia agestis]